MKKFYEFIVVFFVFGLIGCYSEKFIDISNEEGYSKLIGKTYEITGPIIGHGIRKHSNAPVDYVTLMPPPGIGHIVIHKSAGDPRATVKVVNFQGLT